MKTDELLDLILVTLETEIGGVRIYEAAIRCAADERLGEDFRRFLGQTQHRVDVVRSLCETAGLDPDAESAGRQIVRHRAQALVLAMEMALKTGDTEATQIVAAECVVDSESKARLNWNLLHEAAKHATGALASALGDACGGVEGTVNEELRHSAGWARELSLRALGLDAPPPHS